MSCLHLLFFFLGGLHLAKIAVIVRGAAIGSDGFPWSDSEGAPQKLVISLCQRPLNWCLAVVLHYAVTALVKRIREESTKACFNSFPTNSKYTWHRSAAPSADILRTMIPRSKSSPRSTINAQCHVYSVTSISENVGTLLEPHLVWFDGNFEEKKA